MSLTSVWANEKNETALSAHCFHTSNSAVRTAINWSDIAFLSCSPVSRDPRAFRLGSTADIRTDPFQLERVSSNVSCGSQAKRPWISRDGRTRQKLWTWWEKPLGCTGGARWEYPWMKHGETAGIAGNENMKGAWIVHVSPYQGCLPSDFGHMTHHCQIIITSHRPTIEHRWTTNLIESTELIRRPTCNSFGWNAMPPHSISTAFKNKSDYQIMHGQNRLRFRLALVGRHRENNMNKFWNHFWGTVNERWKPLSANIDTEDSK